MSAGLSRAHRGLWLPLSFVWQPASDRATHCYDDFDVIDKAGLDPDGTDKLSAEFLRADWRVDKAH